MRKLNWRLASMFTAVGVVGAIASANAGGFEVRLQSGNGVGRANAGNGAILGDAATMVFNPASLASHTKHQVGLVGNYIHPSAKFNIGTGTNAPSAPGAPVVAHNNDAGGNAASGAFVPAAYLVWNYNEQLKFGLAATVPWGLKTEWGANWVGRYHSLKSEMKTFNISPMFGYKCCDQLLIGGGVQVQYVDVELTKLISNVSSGGLFQRGLIPAPGSLTNQKVTMRGSDWGVGWTAGLLWKPFNNTRLGLSYRSHVTHKLKGDISNPTGLLNAKAEAPLMTPEKVIASLAYDFNQDWTGYADITWTRWSRIQSIDVRAGALSNDIPYKWTNTFTYALGLEWRPDKDWTLRVGGAYDMTPARDEFRTPAVPDAARWWTAAGVGYQFTDDIGLNLNYAHEFVKNAKSNLNGLVAGPAGPVNVNGALVGTYKQHVDIVNLQLNWKF